MDDGIVKFSKLISCDKKMKQNFEIIKKVAPTDAKVLILGETGTGKELVAQAIYEHSNRSNKPFVVFNCAAIPNDLVESYLFGHVKGAFTGAIDDKDGMFKLADGGTLFLDEIGNMNLSTQAKILRVIEEKQIQPIGSNSKIKVDVRIIAATNKDLKEAIKNNEFRSDLYYRISEVIIEIPPLRERLCDLHLILSEIIEEYNKELNKNVNSITVAALGLLQKHSWPGNIRELKNVIKNTMLFLRDSDEQILAEHLPTQIITNMNDIKQNEKKISSSEFLNSIISSDKLLSLDEMINLYINYVLKSVNYNKSKAAEILKINRSTLYEKLKNFQSNK